MKDIKKEYKRKNILLRGDDLPLDKIEKLKGVLSITPYRGEYEVKVADDTVAPQVFDLVKNTNFNEI